MASDAQATFSHAFLGRTGVPVHRLGMRTTGTISVETFEYAMERGINYFYWGWIRDKGTFRENFVEAFRNRLPIRDRLVVAMWYSPWTHSTAHEEVLRNLRTEYIDILLLSVEHVNPICIAEAIKLKQRGVVRWIGITDRTMGQFAPFPKAIAKSNRAAAALLGSGKFDVFQVDFPASVDPVGNTGFWERIPRIKAPGIVADRTADKFFFSACERAALEDPIPTHEDCYRFALSRPEVSVCLCSAGKNWQLDRAITEIEKGPMSEEELARMRRYRWAVAHDPKRVYG